ncbi:MAG: hypothetical protein JNL43_04780 [Flavobacteriales bacterium]|nr:hypothetical protein [Flavobacteriales bacterium]
MKRLPYIIWTTVALAVAYLVLRTVASTGEMFVFPDAWHFLDPFRLIGEDGPQLWITLGVHVALAVVLLVLSIERAQDAGWNRWIGVLMILPVVRLFLFTALAVVPTQAHINALDLPRYAWLDRILPKSRAGNAIASIFFAVLLVVPLGFLNVRMLEDYGLALFIGLPFILGAVSAYLYNHSQIRSLKQSLGIAMLTVTLALAAIFLFAMEGLLCILMAAPIVYAIALAGALVGHALSQRTPGGATAMCLLVLSAPGLMAFEAAHPSKAPLFPVITNVIVHAPPQLVWNELVAFSRMEEPDELLFRAGISYPVEARIEGTGVGACRFCQFNTGPFVEPITVWDEPHLLAFDVLDDPPPMTELTIYEQIDAPHVDGFFRSRNGQFKLIEQAGGSTLLEGTTWYTHDIWPAWYWRIWSDAVLHRIHGRVLEHIRNESEQAARYMEKPPGE